MGIQNTSVCEKQKTGYLPRGRNTLHQVFDRHFTDFCSRYDEEYADTFGKFRLERIQAVYDFLAELTQHIPPKGVQLIRRYGLYSSRDRCVPELVRNAPTIKGAWESMPHVAERAPAGWKIQHESQIGTSEHGYFGLNEDTTFSDDSPDTRAYKKAWARLLSKVYEIEPMVCPKCGSEMKVIAIIQQPAEIDRILRHLVKQGRPPPGFDLASMN